MRKIALGTTAGLSIFGIAAIALAAPAADPAPAVSSIEQAQPAALKKVRFDLGAASAGMAAEKKLLPKGVKTLLKVPQTLEHGDYVWNDEGVAPGKLTVKLLKKNKKAVVLFEDTAPGVSDEDKNRIFEQFFRVENSRNRATGGRGLGLAICASIVDGHQGTISAYHSPDGGLGIKVEFPLN